MAGRPEHRNEIAGSAAADVAVIVKEDLSPVYRDAELGEAESVKSAVIVTVTGCEALAR